MAGGSRLADTFEAAAEPIDSHAAAAGAHATRCARLDTELDTLVLEACLQLERTFYEQVAPAMVALERAVVGMPIERPVADVVAESARLSEATRRLLVRAGEVRALECLNAHLVPEGVMKRGGRNGPLTKAGTPLSSETAENRQEKAE